MWPLKNDRTFTADAESWTLSFMAVTLAPLTALSDRSRNKNGFYTCHQTAVTLVADLSRIYINLKGKTRINSKQPVHCI